MFRRAGFASFARLLVLAAFATACGKKTPAPAAEVPPAAEAPPPSEVPPPGLAAVATVPPIAPVAAVVDASALTRGGTDVGDAPGQTPYEQALAYEASGQYWLGRLVLEKKAVGPTGTAREVELLARICQMQDDPACVAQCEAKLGKKVKRGNAPGRASEGTVGHAEPDTDFSRARAHLLGQRYKEARAILEPKVLDGKATKEEIGLLRSVCKQEGDRMCVALCDAKLK